jgi:tetratricopeptide (TPR) repeat protein
MPSLKNIEAFADLFRSVGGQARILAERGEEPDVLELPDREPEPLPSDDDAAGLLNEDALEPPQEQDVPLDKKAPSPSASGPDDLGDAELESLPGLDDLDDEGAGLAPDFDFGDFSHHADEDLSPLSIDDALPQEFNDSFDELEEITGNNESEDSGAVSTPEDFDLGNFDNPFETSDTEDLAASAAPDGVSDDAPDGAPFDVSDDAPFLDIEDSVPDIVDTSDIEYDDVLETVGDADEKPLEPVILPDLDGEAADAIAGAIALDGLIPEGEAPAVVDESAAPGKYSFDEFDLAGSDAAVQEKSASSEFPGLDEFVIHGVDIPAGGTSADGPGAKADTGNIPADSGEIKLTEEDFSRLEETLQGYPLNLRVACEEAITRTETPPAQVSRLVKLLVRGGSARDAARLAGKILDKDIVIPRGYQKKTGEELEAEQASFTYVFVKKFLPILGLFLFIAGAVAGTVYLGWNFVYKPLKAETLYKTGIERIAAGEYERANERFNEAWRWKPVKGWFYTYAEAFRDARQYFYAEEKYDQLIAYTAMRNKRGIPEEQGVLDYARMETDHLRNYEKADRLIRTHILDWNPDDSEGLLALGDVNMAWGDSNVEFSDDETGNNRDGGRYEAARQNYARHLDLYGWDDPVLERMLLYFIRADNLSEILPLQEYFMSKKKLTIRPATLTELGAYLLDKQVEETRYVRDANVEKIEGVRDILLRSADADPLLPETHYHLARYYAMLDERSREQQYLDNASRLFDDARMESARRIRARIDTEQRVSRLNRDRREFFSAEERLIKSAEIYEDAVERRIFRPSPRFASIYADLGDLAYFTRFSDDSLPGSWQEAIAYYLRAEESGYSTTEMQYRLGSSYYHLSDFRRAEERFFQAATETPPNRRVLNALGNASFLRGSFSAAESCFSKLVSMLQASRLNIIDFRMDDVPEHRDLIERLMIAQNNLGAVYQALAERDGESRYRARALALYSEASRIWDNISRDPATFTRPGLADFSIPSVSLPYLNTANTLYPVPAAKPEIFINIDRDMLDPSPWDYLVSGER